MEDRQFAVAVVGASGAVGSALLTVLEERAFPVGKLHLLGSAREEAQTAVFRNRGYRIGPVADFAFSQVELVFFCAPAAVAAAEVPRAVAAGCRVVDVSSCFRADAAAPLIAADVNGDALATGWQGVVAAPGAAALQAATVLAPLARSVGLKRVAVHTQLAVSDRGRGAIAELAGQTARLLNVQALKSSVFPAQIAFNVVAAFDDRGPAGYTRQEAGFIAEMRRLLGNDALPVSASFAYVPVFYGHSQVIEVETREPLAADELMAVLRSGPGLELLPDDGASVSPVGDSVGNDAVVVGRVRQDAESGLITLWVVADNVRKGAAVNTALIAETLLKPCL